ncbi:hypothetical protein BDK51DRAFT_28853 [Blyttiomyces helicus]|uniref:Uncharacterized protein n=1 Tax=Blyttiomyces helicus TaxID=388810 RepID=A0A4P9WMX9_9FUNG|nr:hypothetical protein BDK51DRAFT_28853 [Blyttiomyces helicus]|eukprot:RKO94451.1 hypothetical protein BDK51DRAFT_28853 [Blyttiomyces helicus]
MALATLKTAEFCFFEGEIRLSAAQRGRLRRSWSGLRGMDFVSFKIGDGCEQRRLSRGRTPTTRLGTWWWCYYGYAQQRMQPGTVKREGEIRLLHGEERHDLASAVIYDTRKVVAVGLGPGNTEGAAEVEVNPAEIFGIPVALQFCKQLMGVSRPGAQVAEASGLGYQKVGTFLGQAVDSAA